VSVLAMRYSKGPLVILLTVLFGGIRPAVAADGTNRPPGPMGSAVPFRMVKDVAYMAPNQTEKLDLYLPARGTEDSPAPAVIWMHGNHHDKGEARERNVCETLAAAGYVCASINYGTWTDSDNDPGTPARDRQNIANAKTAVRFLRAHAGEYRLDPTRIAAFGGSAGGFLALMLGFTDDPGLERVGPWQGISSAVRAIGDFYGDYDPRMRDRLTSKYPPIFIAQGKIDPLVDYRESVKLAQALTVQGVPCEFILMEGVGHSFDLTTWNHQPLPRDLRPAILAFLGKYLGKSPVGGIPPTP
jgi:acetyl esterase/lipase